MAEKIIAFIRMILRFIYKITVIPVKKTILFIFGLIIKFLKFMLRIFKKIKATIYFKSEKRKIIKESSKGFGLYKNNKRINQKTIEKSSEKR